MCYLPFNTRINLCGINKNELLSLMKKIFTPINNIVMKMGEPPKTIKIQTREIQTQTQNPTKLQWNIVEIK